MLCDYYQDIANLKLTSTFTKHQHQHQQHQNPQKESQQAARLLDGQTRGQLDPVYLEDERVLENLLRKERNSLQTATCLGASSEAASQRLPDSVRRPLLEWMLRVCQEQQCQDEIFALATYVLDHFLLNTPLGRETPLADHQQATSKRPSRRSSPDSAGFARRRRVKRLRSDLLAPPSASAQWVSSCEDDEDYDGRHYVVPSSSAGSCCERPSSASSSGSSGLGTSESESEAGSSSAGGCDTRQMLSPSLEDRLFCSEMLADGLEHKSGQHQEQGHRFVGHQHKYQRSPHHQMDQWSYDQLDEDEFDDEDVDEVEEDWTDDNNNDEDHHDDDDDDDGDDGDRNHRNSADQVASQSRDELELRQLYTFASCALLMVSKARQTVSIKVQTLIEASSCADCRRPLALPLTAGEILRTEVLVLFSIKCDLNARLAPSEFVGYLWRKCKQVVQQPSGLASWTGAGETGQPADEWTARRLTQKLLDLSVMDSHMSTLEPSLLAMAAMAAAIHELSHGQTRGIHHLTNIVEQIHDATQRIHKLERMIEVALNIDRYFHTS